MRSQEFLNVQRIKIKSSVNVSIIKGDQFYVHISGDDAEKVKISESDSEVKVEYCEPSNNSYTSFIGGNFVVGNIMQVGGRINNVNNQTVMRNSTVGGKNISIINGEVYVNGKRQVDEDTPANTKPQPPAKKPIEIEIRCPNGLAIECILIESAVLSAFPKFEEARITIEGVGEAEIQARSGKLKIMGTGDINYTSLGGNLKMNINGSGDIQASGDFKDVDASINGTGDIITNGNVAGDYEANICGCGDIKHSGRISGKRYNSISGTGSVKW